MAEPFLGEIRMMSFQFAPKGWAPCNGQMLPINQQQALFSLLGTTYGGNGQTTFALPDLRGRTPVHAPGGATNLGQQGGEVAHTLTIQEIPSHQHMLMVAAGGNQVANPSGQLLATANNLYYSSQSSWPTLTSMSSTSIAPAGGGQPHENMQPYLTIGFCIALVGIFPSRN
jgi:microcystin-dependent protein